jgi:hypothetical protein
MAEQLGAWAWCLRVPCMLAILWGLVALFVGRYIPDGE